jgi:hypothetical protein
MSGLPPLTHDRIPVQEQNQNTYCRIRWLFKATIWATSPNKET